jgi:hypothetical protein
LLRIFAAFAALENCTRSDGRGFPLRFAQPGSAAQDSEFASSKTRLRVPESSGVRLPSESFAGTPVFHTCNIHEIARKVNANLQFVTLFVRYVHITQLNPLRFVHVFVFATDFSRFFSSLLHFGYKSDVNSYKSALQNSRSQAVFRVRSKNLTAIFGQIWKFSPDYHIPACCFDRFPV